MTSIVKYRNIDTVCRDMFPTFCAENLHTHGVLDMQNCPYVFVNQAHPVIHLLRQNETLLGVNIDSVPKMDNEWYKLSRPLMTSCCSTVKKEVLDKITNVSFRDFQVVAHQIGGVPFNHLDACDVPPMTGVDMLADPATLKRAMDAHVRAVTQKPCTLTMRIALEYTLGR